MIPDREGPRASERTPEVDTDSYENHLLLCVRCHTLVDKEEAQFPSNLLIEWKTQHQEWIEGLIMDALSNVSFEELEIVCDAIVGGDPGGEVSDLSLTAPQAKMERNGLTDRLQAAISMGLSQAHVVRAFLGEYEELDPGFPDRLIDGFQREYHLAMATGLRGDNLFSHLTAHSTSDVSLQAAQLTLVAYLFHSCDLFEQ